MQHSKIKLGVGMISASNRQDLSCMWHRRGNGQNEHPNAILV